MFIYTYNDGVTKIIYIFSPHITVHPKNTHFQPTISYVFTDRRGPVLGRIENDLSGWGADQEFASNHWSRWKVEDGFPGVRKEEDPSHV